MKEKITNFKCQRCGKCCRIEGIVRLNENETEKISAAMGLSCEEFIEKYTELSPDRKSLILKERADGTCILLIGDNLCAVNEVKPHQCKTFPHEWTNPTSAEYCPGLAAEKCEKVS